VHHLVEGEGGTLMVCDAATFFRDGGELASLGLLQGSRPLALCHACGRFYYGEYRANAERSAVHVWGWQPGAETWSPAWQFDDVRHVHGVFFDAYAGAIWVTTGDRDSESALWRSDDGFATLTKVVGGSQQLRAVQLLFTRDYVYFGSDTPDQKNHIYRLDRVSRKVEQLTAVGGSVFYGCKVGDSLFLSTAVEPGGINSSNKSEVWRSDNGREWYKFLEFEKDAWSMKYFQYGQVHFPAGPGDGRHLYCTPFATRGHGKTLVIDIEQETAGSTRNTPIETG